MSAPHPSEPRSPRSPTNDQQPIRWMPGFVEIAASLTALVAMGALLRNKLRTELTFFGEIPDVTRDHVTTYWTWLVVLAAAVAGSFAAAFWRRRPVGHSVWWHGLVLVLGVAVAVLAHVSV